MNSQTLNARDRSVTDASPNTRQAMVDQAGRLIRMLQRNALVPDIRDELFPTRSARQARDLIVRMAERPEFAAAICTTWGNDVGAAGVSAWRSWCGSRRTSRDRLRSLRRLVRLCDDIHAFISGDAM